MRFTDWLFPGKRDEEEQEMKVSPERLALRVSSIRKEKRTIATLNGAFDLLHAGHVHIIAEAKKQADHLIVLLNSDVSIKTYKCQQRPLMTLEHRLTLISALRAVDDVTWFDQADPRSVLEMIRPDVHVNGSEYGAQCIEAPVVEQYGGSIHIVRLIPDLSTTAIIAKIHSFTSDERERSPV